MQLQKKDLVEEKAVEVGNIFTLGTRFSKPLGLKYTDENGEQKNVFMGSYGIGPGRVMGTIVEVYNDEKGILWPETIAPFKVHLIELRKNMNEDVYRILQKNEIEVIYDDRDCSAGIKFNDADLMGMPYRLVLSDKLKDKVELKRRNSEDVSLYTQGEVIEILKGNYN